MKSTFVFKTGLCMAVILSVIHPKSYAGEPLCGSAGPCSHAPTVDFIVDLPDGGASLDAAALARLTESERHMVEHLYERITSNMLTPAFCFSGPVSSDVAQAIESVLSYGRAEKFYGVDGDRWTTTVTNGAGLAQGTPITITYSFVPDGTNLLDGVTPLPGESTDPSDLFATFNAAFGSTSAWQDLIRSVFTFWSSNSSITYVEVSDDGANFPTSAGAAGLRGDIRIGGHSIDGAVGPNILAYNYFPNTGDMVIDTDNAAQFASSTANGFRLFRNTISHEHGHGMGFDHVCPNNGLIIMEPFVPTGAGAPDLLSIDDIAHIHRKYGDANEASGRNDTAGTATALGALNDASTTVEAVSLDSVDDVDVYTFSVAGPSEVSVTLRPVGGSFNIAEQPDPGDATCTGAVAAAFDLSARINLGFQIIDTDGTTVLTTVNAAGAGTNETIVDFALPAAGTYFIRVFTNDADTTGTVSNQDAQIQLYELDVATGTAEEPEPPEPIPTVPVGAPAHGPLGLAALTLLVAAGGAWAVRRRRR